MEKFMTIIEIVQIPYLNTEGMIRSDGEVFIKITKTEYYDKPKFLELAANLHMSKEFIKERIDLFNSIYKYAKEKYNF